MRAHVVTVLVVAALAASTLSYPAEYSKQQNASEPQYPTLSHQPVNYRLEDLTGQQSDNIRHITNEQRNHDEVPRQVKKEKSIVTIEEDRFPSLEELRLKCQHFSRLFGLNQYGSSTTGSYDDIDRYGSSSLTADRSENYNKPVIEVTRRPIFIRNKPAFVQKNNNGGFYVTTSSSLASEQASTKRPLWASSTIYPKVTSYSPAEYSSKYLSTTVPSTSTRISAFSVKVTNTTEATTINSTGTTTTIKPKIKVKYTKFEPVILQKTILTDGRVMYHWHRSLPTATLDLSPPIATPIVSPSAYEYAPNQFQRNLEPSSSTTTTSTTTEKSSWLFVPFSNLFGGSRDEETTTVESSTAIPWSTTTPNASTDELKPTQLKLVVPIQYDDIDSNLAAQNNRLSYYRPQATNQAVPPSSLHIIKTLGVPQTVPRYSLGYTGTGYGLFGNNGLPYGGLYSPEYTNYQAYNVPLKRENNGHLDDVTM